MVKSYDRFELEKSFGVISSQSNLVWIPSDAEQSSRSSGRVISSGVDEILIWDVKSGELLEKFQDGVPLGASDASTMQAPSPVTFLAHHESGILAAGYANGNIKVWDMASGSVIINFQGHKSSITIIRFDKSGTRIVSGSSDTTIILWDLVGEEGLFKLKGHKGEIRGVDFLREYEVNSDIDSLDTYLVSVSKEGTIKLWDLRSQQCIETHLAHSNECWSLGVDVDKSLLVTSGNKTQAKLWTIDLLKPDTQKLSEVGTLEKQSKARCLEIAFRKFRSMGEDFDIFYLQNADRTVELYRLRNADELKKGIANRTKRLKAKGYSSEEILESLKESEISMRVASLQAIRADAKVKSCCWIASDVPNLKRIDLVVSLVNNCIEYYRLPVDEGLKKIKPSEAHTSKQYSIDLPGHRADIRSMDLSSDNKLLATVSDGEMKIWNIINAKVIRSFALASGYALSCKFLPGGSLIVVAFKSGALELYDLATSSLVERIEKAHGSETLKDNNEAAIWSLDLTPDGKTLVSGGNDKKVKFWDFKVEQELVPGADTYINKMKIVHKRTLEVTDDVLCVKISPDARFLAISLLNNNVNVVFFDTLKLYLTLYGHKLPVLSIDISHDCKLVITSSADKNIKIWGLDFGDCHKSIFGHTDSVMSVKFIDSTHNFFSAGKDGVIKYWDGDKFECIQKIPAHQSEVWCLVTSSDGSFVISTSHDHSIKLFSITNDQVFIEEEREKEMDEMYENTLLDNLEEETAKAQEEEDDNQNSSEVERISKQTIASLKAGERLMEALDIGTQDLDSMKAYENELRDFKLHKRSAPPSKPVPHTILQAYGVSGQQYVLDTVLKIRSSQLEDALLVLPFSYCIKILRFIQVWTDELNVSSNIVFMSVICKILFFIVRSNAKELTHQKDPALKKQLLCVKNQLRTALKSAANKLGYNTHGLRFILQQWKLTHEFEFVDEAQQKEYEDKKALKRTFVTI